MINNETEQAAGQQQSAQSEVRSRSVRAKVWAECSLDEKIDRLRDTFLSIQSVATDNANALDEVRSTLLEHAHLGDKVVVPARRSHYGGGTIVRDGRGLLE